VLSATNEPHAVSKYVDANHTIHTVPHKQPTSDMEFLDDIGISSEEFRFIVQQMGDSETIPDNMLTLD
jgi:hypothetical protein